MGYSTNYTGPQIDAALEKGQSLRVVNNGWIRLESSAATPIDFNNLKNPGNYTTAFWINGPDFGDISITPINISIVIMNDDLYQFVTAMDKSYVRVMAKGEDFYGDWIINQSDGAINPSPDAPSGPIDGKTIWLDTSNATAPTLKLYVDGEWKNIIPEGSMETSIYDPQGKKTDIFKYIDDAVASVSVGSFGNVDEHINDTTIHVTSEEKASWNNSATTTDIANATATLETSLETKVSELVSTEVEKVEELSTIANETQNSLNAHIEDVISHPSEDKKAEWDAKAAGDHTHNLDGRVTVDTDHIVGTVSSDLLPYDVKERVYVISSESELYSITKNPVHNGDTFCIESDSGNVWYFVVNDEYLGNTEIDPETSLPMAAKAFKKFAAGNIDWNGISNTPTTLAGYGITDAVSKEEFAAVETEVAEISAAMPEEVDLSKTIETHALYTEAVADLDALDAAISGMDALIAKVEDIAK